MKSRRHINQDEVTNDPISSRFWAKVIKMPGTNACWLWCGARNARGYGWFTLSNGQFLAHRISAAISFKIESNCVVVRKCSHNHCVNPSHLKIISMTEFQTRRVKSNEIRFWIKVDRRSNNECWNWKAGITSKGYGIFGTPLPNGRWKKWQAHRYSYFFKTGRDPKFHLCHKCDNRKCVNPSHLFEGTDYDNFHDMINKKGPSYLAWKNRRKRGKNKNGIIQSSR